MVSQAELILRVIILCFLALSEFLETVVVPLKNKTIIGPENLRGLSYPGKD